MIGTDNNQDFMEDKNIDYQFNNINFINQRCELKHCDEIVYQLP